VAHVFERGYHGAGSPGEGLGLHGARVLMREQGGELALDPTGPGARFVLTLPATQVGVLAGGQRSRPATTQESR
jgi:signal transduction histidine kinase